MSILPSNAPVGSHFIKSAFSCPLNFIPRNSVTNKQILNLCLCPQNFIGYSLCQAKILMYCSAKKFRVFEFRVIFFWHMTLAMQSYEFCFSWKSHILFKMYDSGPVRFRSIPIRNGRFFLLWEFEVLEKVYDIVIT